MTLIQFTVENFLSFKDKVVFSMLATSDELHTEHLLSSPAGKNKRTLRAAAIYGANASGKSNLVKAMKFAQDLIVKGTEPEEMLAVSPFKLASMANKPSRFQFVFAIDEAEYTYGFALNCTMVLEEYLHAKRNGHRIIYFERVTSEALKTLVEPGPSLVKGSKEIRRFIEYKAADTRHNELFLSAVFAGNISERIEQLKPIMNWFRSVLTIIEPETVNRTLELRAHRTKALKEYLGELLITSGTGIDAVHTNSKPLDWDRDLPWLPVRQREEVLQAFKTKPESRGSNDYTMAVGGPNGEHYYVREDKQGNLWILKLILKHTDDKGNRFDFQLNEESDGTQRLVHLGPMLYDLSEGLEKVLVIDELDCRLHPHLSRMFVQAAMRFKYENQLIFTTHDTNLLDLDLLRRDEIWFVKKQSDGSSHLYSLAEYKVRPDLQIEKGYLNGRFGAIPLVGDIGSLGSQRETEETLELTHA